MTAPVGWHVLVWTAVEHYRHRGSVWIGRGNIPMPAYCDYSASIVPCLYGRDVGIINPSPRASSLQVDVIVAVDGGIFARERMHLVRHGGVPGHLGHRSREDFLPVVGHQFLV